MGLRSFLGLISPAEEETNNSLSKYRRCRYQRRGQLINYRSHAALHLMKEMPDLELVMDVDAPVFMGASAMAQKFIAGSFVDRIYPPLELALDEDENHVRDKAVAEFVRKSRLYDSGDFEGAGISDVDTGGEYFCEKDLTRGYKFKSIPFDHLSALTLVKNGMTIAHTNSWEPEPLNKILSSLANNVLFECAGSPRDVSRLELRIIYMPDACSIGEVVFEQFYSDLYRRSAEMDSRERKAICEHLGKLIATLHTHVNTVPVRLVEDDPEDEVWAREAYLGMVVPRDAQ